MAQTANAHHPEVAALCAAYLALLGADEAASPASAYRGWLDINGVALGKATSWRFAQDPRIGAPALHFASLQLALGQHAASFFPETLGFTLAYLRSDSPWRLPALPPPRRQAVLEAMALHTRQAQQAWLACGGEGERLERGYALYQAAEAAYLNALRHHAAVGASLAEQVAEIFRRKRRFAQGYHAGIALGGQSLEDWFAAPGFDAAGFLSAFAASPYAAGQAGQRPFDRLTAFGGPMFGVFDREETALIDAWLDQSGGQGQAGAVSKAAPVFSPVAAYPRGAVKPEPSHWQEWRRDDNRRLFHHLVGHDPPPETLAAARRQVETILARSRRSLSRRGPLHRQFFDYSPSAFAERIARIHDQEIAKHQPFQAPPKLRREEYVWGIRQFAPAILVDGCWLRHQGEAVHQDSRVHRLLHCIYVEELGEGRAEWNHPRIYQDLLAGLGMDLPAPESESFSLHPGFLDSAFDLPAYLLAISQYPKTYFPETLGLNLAIELSGLGAGYLRLIEELRHWHIDPLIVKLHLSIDNLAGGHAAMACEAVQAYLDEMRELGGEHAVQEAWRRIWSGYLSLATATRRFKWMLILEFCRRFLPGRLLSCLKRGPP